MYQAFFNFDTLAKTAIEHINSRKYGRTSMYIELHLWLNLYWFSNIVNNVVATPDFMKYCQETGTLFILSLIILLLILISLSDVKPLAHSNKGDAQGWETMGKQVLCEGEIDFVCEFGDEEMVDSVIGESDEAEGESDHDSEGNGRESKDMWEDSMGTMQMRAWIDKMPQVQLSRHELVMINKLVLRKMLHVLYNCVISSFLFSSLLSSPLFSQIYDYLRERNKQTKNKIKNDVM